MRSQRWCLLLLHTCLAGAFAPTRPVHCPIPSSLVSRPAALRAATITTAPLGASRRMAPIASAETSRTSAAPEIHTIDISPFFRDDPAGRKAAGQEVRRACEGCGLFYVTGHQLPTADAEAALSSSRSLFRLPADQKQLLPSRADGGFIRGFIGVGGESGSPTLYEAKEAYSYGFEWGPAGPPESLRNSLAGENLWPDPSSGLGEDWKAPLVQLFKHKVEISRALTSAMALAMGKAEHELLDMCETGDSISIMRCFHYLPLPNASAAGAGSGQEVIGSSPHTDWGWLTVILQEPGVTALQLYHEGTWWDVEPRPDTLLVNVGDYVSLMTAGRFSSPLHRVVIDPRRERHSFVFFFYPSFDAAIPSLLPAAESEGAAGGVSGGGGGALGRYSLLASQNKAEDGASQARAPPSTFGDFITRKWAEVQR